MKPIRMCTICRKRQEKENYIRIVCDENNNTIYDKNQKINARAIYICKDKICINKAFDMINKNKLSVKIPVNKDSLINTLKNVENELGE